MFNSSTCSLALLASLGAPMAEPGVDAAPSVDPPLATTARQDDAEDDSTSEPDDLGAELPSPAPSQETTLVSIEADPAAAVSKPVRAAGPVVSRERLPADEPAPASPERSARPRKARWLGGVGITGMVLATGGVATVAVGTVFIDCGTQRELDPDDDTHHLVRDGSRMGWILYGAGLAGAALGGLMLALDVTVLHERRLSRLAVKPAIDPTYAGLRLRGSF